MNVDIQKFAMARLVSHHGWTADRLLTCVVTKQYPTAVGLKQASAYIRKDNTVPQYWMNGDYQSEGRNALAIAFACIPANADVATVEAHVDAFAATADKLVAETYAARLLKM